MLWLCIAGLICHRLFSKQSQTTCAWIRSDKGLTLETSVFESLYGGQLTLSTQLIKPNYLVILPPTQHHSFFRNLPPLYVCSILGDRGTGYACVLQNPTYYFGKSYHLKHTLAISAKFFEKLPPFHLLLRDVEKKRFVLACCCFGELVKVIWNFHWLVYIYLTEVCMLWSLFTNDGTLCSLI